MSAEPTKITTACSIGKHALCDGTGNDADRPFEQPAEPFECSCPCHDSERRS